MDKEKINIFEYLPEPWGTLYAPPNPDGSRKNCGNCWAWVKEGKCLIHKKTLKVIKDAVCGFHIFGKPKDEWEDLDIEPYDSKLSGLIKTKGTSCDLCIWYEGKEKGICLGVSDGKNKPAKVQAKGCCARWEKKE